MRQNLLLSSLHYDFTKVPFLPAFSVALWAHIYIYIYSFHIGVYKTSLQNVGYRILGRSINPETLNLRVPG